MGTKAYTYEIINCSGGDPRYVEPYHLGTYKNLSDAIAAYRERNTHLFDRDFAQRHGLSNAGTFDRIIRLDEDGDVVDWNVPPYDDDDQWA